jgi:septal ring-binding cell division protein DamX
LFASSTETNALNFIEKWANTLPQLRTANKMKNGTPIFVVIYGKYPCHLEAKQAIANLPVQIRRNRPWVAKMQGNTLVP